ncbi:MAG: SRPBCC domain-containing protein, partial [Burkholderiales bacterium]
MDDARRHRQLLRARREDRAARRWRVPDLHRPRRPPGSKGADDMRFMALQPKKMLSFDWNAPSHLPAARAQRTFVVLRFEPVNDKQTRVTLHHTGWGDGGEWDQAYAYFDRAWVGVLNNLEKRFDQGPRTGRSGLKKWRED